MNNSIIMDIETGPLDISQLTALIPEFKPDSRLKDPEKIKLDLESKKQDWLSEAALHANTGQILAIGILHGIDWRILHSKPETDIINEFWDRFEHSVGASFIGHYIKGFDVPFIMRRSWLLGIKIPFGVINGRYLSPRFIDTMEVWSCGVFKETISLDNLSKACGLKGKNGDGKDFSKLFETDKDKALEYLANDLKLVKGVAKQMGLI